MNLLCPNCQQMLQVPEQFAGQMMKCPKCSGTFTVPALPTQPSAAPPPMPAPAYGGMPAEPAAPLPMGDYQHIFSVRLRPDLLRWLAPAALIAVFVLLFFSWIEYGASTNENTPPQPFSGWSTVFGDYSTPLGTLFGIVFIVTMLSSIAVTVLTLLPAHVVPPAIQPFLPWTHALVSAGALLCLVTLLVQLLPNNLGAEQQPEEIRKSLVTVLKDGRMIYVGFIRTLALRFTVFCTILAVIGSSLTAWLNMRAQHQPLPRIDFSW